MNSSMFNSMCEYVITLIKRTFILIFNFYVYYYFVINDINDIINTTGRDKNRNVLWVY